MGCADPITRPFKKIGKEIGRFGKTIEKEIKRPELIATVLGYTAFGPIGAVAAYSLYEGYETMKGVMPRTPEMGPAPPRAQISPTSAAPKTVMAAQRAGRDSEAMKKRRRYATAMASGYGALNIGTEKLGT